MGKMTKLKIIFLSIITTVIINFFLCKAVKGETGDVKKGKILFNDSKIAGSLTDDSCNTCHYNGNGLEKSGKKKEFTLLDGNVEGIEKVVNICIDNYMLGKKLDVKGKDMADIVAHIKSFGEVAAESKKTYKEEQALKSKESYEKEPVPESKITYKKEPTSKSKKTHKNEPYSNYMEEYRKKKELKDK